MSGACTSNDRYWRARAAVAVAVGLLLGCGGDGSGGGSPNTEFPASATVADQCVAPRPASTIDPFTGAAYGDKQGTVATEKSWVRSWINETYLWYREVPTLDAAAYASALTYFEDLKTPVVTASGKEKDQFHFTYPTPEWVALAQSGIELGYGIEFAALSTTVPRRFVVAFTEPGTQAATNNVARGAELIAVDGVDFVNGSDVTAINAALFPVATSPSHTFTFRDLGAATNRTLTLTPAQITRTPVPSVTTLQTATGKVGYLLFNDHIATSEAQLVSAIDQLIAAGPISDLVLDIRYNGGGYLDIASELAFMIAGSSRTTGKTFERIAFNDKNPFNFTAANTMTPFHPTAQGFTVAAGQVLPQLNLGRVFVLTGAGTCSASEAIINSLRGIDVSVIQVGATTCGKPYGFFPGENCGITYFAIQFQGVNEKGFGDYADGFVPSGSAGNGIPGCVVSDDFTHALGDPAEGRLAAALTYRATGICPTATASSRDTPLTLRSLSEPTLFRSPVRENRIYRQR